MVQCTTNYRGERVSETPLRRRALHPAPPRVLVEDSGLTGETGLLSLCHGNSV